MTKSKAPSSSNPNKNKRESDQQAAEKRQQRSPRERIKQARDNQKHG